MTTASRTSRMESSRLHINTGYRACPGTTQMHAFGRPGKFAHDKVAVNRLGQKRQKRRHDFDELDKT